MRALTIALAFHQWLEGIALGGFIVSAGFSRLKGAVYLGPVVVAWGCVSLWLALLAAHQMGRQLLGGVGTSCFMETGERGKSGRVGDLDVFWGKEGAMCLPSPLELLLVSTLVPPWIPFHAGMFMIATYSLTCPIGVAIGIGIADTYDEGSVKAIATQGVFNGVSAGMLLYIALVQLIAEDVSRREITRQQWWVRPASYGCLFLGAAVMAILGIWA